VPAARVVLAPPEPWSEDRLLAAARALPPVPFDLRVGEEIGGFLVVGVAPAESPSVDIVPRAPPRHTRELDVTVLLDCGESMATRFSAEHTRLQAAEAALVAFLRGTPKRIATVSVTTFAAHSREALPPMPPSVVRSFDVPKPAGRAMAADAIEAALAEGHGVRARALILLTDGPSPEERLLDAARRAGRLGVPIHVVVFAPGDDEALAAVARESGGTIQRATLPLAIEFPEEFR
jgi:hypothetical protein